MKHERRTVRSTGRWQSEHRVEAIGEQSDQLVGDEVHEPSGLISGEVRAPGGPITWTMILQYKYVEQVVHDVKYMNSGEESAMAMK